jgi:hypothetical protein
MAAIVVLPKFRAWVPSTGALAASYVVRTFAAGTSTPLAVYNDAALTVPAANPFTLDANGEAVVYAAAGSNYKIQLYDPTNTTQQWSVDNVTIGGSGSSSGSGSQWIATGLTPSFIGTTSFSVVGDQRTTLAIGARLQTTNTAGTIYCTITNSTFGGGITTVTVTMAAPGDSGVLDSGLSVVNVGILTPANRSIPDPSAVNVITTTQSLSTGVVATIGGGGTSTVQYDILGEYSNGVFTAKQPGIYLITVFGQTSSAGVTFTSAPDFLFSGTGVPSGISNAPIGRSDYGATQTNSVFISYIAKMAAGQTLSAGVNAVFSAGSITLGTCSITIARLGT